MLDYDKFKNMKPMKYYEPGGLQHPKAQEMVNNKDDAFLALEKLDGEWARVIIMEDEVLIQSRSVSKVTGTYGDKTHHVPHIIEDLLKSFPAGTVLLGELAFEDRSKTSRDVGSILRCLPPKAINRQEKEKLHLFVFDCLAWDGRDLSDKPFEDRFGEFSQQIFHIDCSGCSASYIHIAKTGENFMELAEECWEQGGEGIVIVRKSSLYNPGGRKSWDSLKVKKKLGEIDMKIIDTIEPKKDYDGTELESWKYFMDNKPVTKPYYNGWKNGVIVEYEGRIIKVASGLSDEDRAWLATNAAKEAIESGGLHAAITGMELTEDSIRHPVFIGFKNK